MKHELTVSHNESNIALLYLVHVFLISHKELQDLMIALQGYQEVVVWDPYESLDDRMSVKLDSNLTWL